MVEQLRRPSGTAPPHRAGCAILPCATVGLGLQVLWLCWKLEYQARVPFVWGPKEGCRFCGEGGRWWAGASNAEFFVERGERGVPPNVVLQRPRQPRRRRGRGAGPLVFNPDPWNNRQHLLHNNNKTNNWMGVLRALLSVMSKANVGEALGPVKEELEKQLQALSPGAVSYTHLTLPTKRIV